MIYNLEKGEDVDCLALQAEISASLAYEPTVSAMNGCLFVGSFGVDEEKLLDIVKQHVTIGEEIRKAKRFNIKQKQKRREMYEEYADPLCFKVLAGEISMEEWKAKRNQIKEEYPLMDVPELPVMDQEKPKPKGKRK